MNKNQKILTVSCILLVFLTLCFVPCEYKAKVPPGDKNYGYGKGNLYVMDKTMPIWNIKSIYSKQGGSPSTLLHYNLLKTNYAAVFTEWGAILVAYLGLFFVLKPKGTDL